MGKIKSAFYGTLIGIGLNVVLLCYMEIKMNNIKLKIDTISRKNKLIVLKNTHEKSNCFSLLEFLSYTYYEWLYRKSVDLYLLDKI